MPDPFTTGESRTEVAAHVEDVGAQAERDRMMAEALDVIRHAHAFTLTAVGKNGSVIRVTIGDGVSVGNMLMLFAEASEYADENATRYALAFLTEAVENLPPDEGDES